MNMFILLNFTFAKNNTNIRDLFAFPNFRKVAKFAAFIKRPQTKNVSATEGLCPWTPLGSPPQTPDKLALRALALLPVL